eukprot:10928945-Lingulodinium_polyedra.AAC.1
MKANSNLTLGAVYLRSGGTPGLALQRPSPLVKTRADHTHTHLRYATCPYPSGHTARQCRAELAVT